MTPAMLSIKALLSKPTQVNLELARRLAIGQGIDIDECTPNCDQCNRPVGFGQLVHYADYDHWIYICEPCMENEAECPP